MNQETEEHITGVAVNIQNLVTNSRESWITLLSSNGKELGKVRIKKGYYWVTLFPMTMLQLTMVLRDEVAGFRFSGSREKVNHLLFMDDLKPYRRNDFEIERLVGILKGHLNHLGVQSCLRDHTKRDMMVCLRFGWINPLKLLLN